MARRIFFSFDYDRDLWRAGQIRDCWLAKPDRETSGFVDAVAWEQGTWKGNDEVKKWIDRELEGATVTVVLIGIKPSAMSM